MLRAATVGAKAHVRGLSGLGGGMRTADKLFPYSQMHTLYEWERNVKKGFFSLTIKQLSQRHRHNQIYVPVSGALLKQLFFRGGYLFLKLKRALKYLRIVWLDQLWWASFILPLLISPKFDSVTEATWNFSLFSINSHVMSEDNRLLFSHLFWLSDTRHK